MSLKKSKKHVVSKLKAIGTMLTLFAIKTNMVFAAEGGTTIGTAEVTQATDNIKRVITSIAMPLGGVLIFASVVVAAIKMIANSNNPQKRAESIGSLAWICGRWRCFRCKFNNRRNNCKYCNKQYWWITWWIGGAYESI